MGAVALALGAALAADAALGAAEPLAAGAAEPLAAGAAAASGAPPSSGSGGVQPLAVKRTLPKRDALWKLPCPRIGDQPTPLLSCIA